MTTKPSDVRDWGHKEINRTNHLEQIEEGLEKEVVQRQRAVEIQEYLSCLRI